MTERNAFTADAAAPLIGTWQLALRAEDKTPVTITVYTHGVQTYLTWRTQRGAAPLTRTSLTTWISEMLDAGATPGAAWTRRLAIHRYAAWLIAVGHLHADPFLGIKGPRSATRWSPRSPTTNSAP